MKSRYSTSVVVAAMGLSCAAQAGLWAAANQTQWQNTDIADVSMLAASSLALDAQGNARIAYHTDGALKYVSRSGARWIVETVDTAYSRSFASLALDAQGNPHIAYAHMAGITGGKYRYVLKYASKNGSNWTFETADEEGYVGQVSLALDVQGHPHIAYHDTIRWELKYAVKRGAIWVIEKPDLADSIWSSVSLALDAHGNAHIAYQHLTEVIPATEPAPAGRHKYGLRYASNVGGIWKNQQVDFTGNVGWYVSLAVDAHDNPHIAYYEMTQWMSSSNLKYATESGGSWAVETVDTALGNPSNASLALDALGDPHIAYYDGGTEGNLKYASKSGDGWTRETVDPTPLVGWHASLKLDAQDNPRIAYWAWDANKLKYAWLN